MRKCNILLFVMLMFLWTGCSAVHQKTTTSLPVTTRISDEASKIYVVRIADVFCDNTSVTEQHIQDSLIRVLEVKLNSMSRVAEEDDLYTFTHPSVRWHDVSTLQIQVKKSLRKNGEELEWLLRTYTASVEMNHDAEKKDYEVRLTSNSIVTETASAGYYKYVPDDVYVPSKCNLTNIVPSPWGKHDIAVRMALGNTMQDIMDENENVVFYQKMNTVSFSEAVSGDPEKIRVDFMRYMADERESAIVTPRGVFFDGKLLVQLIDTIEGVTFLSNVKLPEEVGLKEIRHRLALDEWVILALTKEFVKAQ
ncbi:hypothetical protein [Halodesulfovibrio marinisediminis]|uniref:Uncharacterized protein n=1 Tax=Halodesulfovibrio marinisediminis DSM 17456 TaxID=1121457 RepID=A0A1N6HYF7_9BACT|nr:hypothetical protein [Halodesulfovibrio marinisediminis]SIO24854.1 hypothetical protein SAMN02745161_2282 [Halodesulfovibrio marinisediminis DSM 17456]